MNTLDILRRNGRGISASLSVLVCSVALAQPTRRPEPPAPLPEPAPPRLLAIENAGEFLAAYNAAQRPRFVIFTRLDTKTKSGNAAADDRGFVSAFSGRLQGLYPAAQMNLVNLAAAELADAALAKRLEEAGDADAAREIATRVKADVVLYVVFTEINARPDGAQYVGRYILLDVRTGRQLGTWSWDLYPDINGSFTSIRLGQYAAEIGRRTADEFIANIAMASGRRFNLTVSGVFDQDKLLAFEDALKAVAGMDAASVMFRGQEVMNTKPIFNFELNFTGSLLRLQDSIKRIAENNFGLAVENTSTKEGTLLVRFVPARMPKLELDLAGDGLDTDANKVNRDRFRAAYDKQGAPRIAVMVNAELPAMQSLSTPAAAAPATTPAASNGGGTPVNVTVSSKLVLGDDININGLTGVNGALLSEAERQAVRDRLERERRAFITIDTANIEAAMYERLSYLRARIVDGSAVTMALHGADNAQAQQTFAGDDGLVKLLASKVPCDIVIAGTGRLVRSATVATATTGGEPVALRLSFRAVRVRDGAVLGSASGLQADVTGFDEAKMAETVKELSIRATGKLVAQMLGQFEASQSLEVTIEPETGGVVDPKSVQAIADALRDRFARKSDGSPLVTAVRSGASGSTASLMVAYAGNFDELLGAIVRAEGLPFELKQGGVSNSGITVRPKAVKTP